MYKPLLFTIILFLFGCQNKNYEITIADSKKINNDFLQNLEDSEKALISMYLLAYGNECSSDKITLKCKILEDLNIDNECDKKHIEFLKQWFSSNKLMLIKLQNCPNLPHNFAIQNRIEKIILKKKKDTLTIIFNIKGINESQEKTWNFTQKDRYIIKNKGLIKI